MNIYYELKLIEIFFIRKSLENMSKFKSLIISALVDFNKKTRFFLGKFYGKYGEQDSLYRTHKYLPNKGRLMNNDHKPTSDEDVKFLRGNLASSRWSNKLWFEHY